MISRSTSCLSLIVLGLIFLCLIGLSGCQSQAPSTDIAAPLTQSTQTSSSDPQSLPVESTAAQDETASNETEPDQAGPVETTPEETAPDPAAIEVGWKSSPHADSYVLDSDGQNNTCARCHAPINWMPTMDDLPESCFACKFELEDPPSLIKENDWVDIPCNVCHTVDKKDNIQAEIAWLEIAPLGEYTAVASPTELCLKCHAPADIPEHGDVVLGGAHANYECTGCHSAHDTMASCSAVDCHSDVVEPATPIPGHDADHQAVSCVACHDGSGMQIGPDEETGLWTTFAAEPAADGSYMFAFTSHNTVLEAPCDRCHYTDNPWSLSESVVVP